MGCTLLGRRVTSTPDLGVLHLGNVMSHDVGAVVLRHLASTQDSVRVCRGVDQLPTQFPRLERLAFDLVSSNTSKLLAKLAQTKPHLLAKLQELDLSNCSGVEAHALAQVLRACSSLQSLTLPPLSHHVTCTRHDVMQVLSSYAPQLKCLLGAGDYICPASIQLLPQLPHLQRLDIQPVNCSPRISAAALRPIAQLSNLQLLELGNNLACHDTFALAAALPGLSSLVFSFVSQCSLAPSELVPLTYSRSLQAITLSGVTCSDDLLAVLARTPITALTLTASRFAATPKGASVLQQQLTQLQLRVNDQDIGAVAAALPVLKGLKGLSVAVHRAGEDCTGLMQAIFGLSQLETLALESHYNGLTVAELSGLPVMPQLQQVALRNHFSDATLSAILHCTPQLQQLKLASCSEVGVAGLNAIVTNCRGIREVHLELMRAATAVGVAAVAAAPLVRRVVVEGCRNITVEECREVVRSVDKLDLEVVKLR